MNGTEDLASGTKVTASGSVSAISSLRRTTDAWERFAAGAETVRGVRPEILTSWYRCREEYQVDPSLARAPAAAEAGAHSMEHDAMFAEIGGLAASAAREVDGLDGVVTVADSEGRVLASWGSDRATGLASDANLAPWAAWSEWSCGTNGMGTALETHAPVLVRGAEHWCAGFHLWTCAGVAVRDVVTDDPLAVLNISCPDDSLPDAVLPWLRAAAESARAKLRQRARQSGILLVAAFAEARLPATTALAAIDLAGKVVLANREAAVLLGTPADAPAYTPVHRWRPAIPTVPQLTKHVARCARQDPEWAGTTQIFVPFLRAAIGVAARPVFCGTQVIGTLLAFGTGHEALAGQAGSVKCDLPPAIGGAGDQARGVPSRVVALREDRWVLLDPREIRYAEADQNKVWIVSDVGRLLAASRGLDHLERQLGGRGFLRVHRRFLVNLARIREIEPGFKGTLFVTTDSRDRETVPVARRHAPELRLVLGM
jgi:hypothetical protein